MSGLFRRIDVEVDYWKKSAVQARYSSEEMSSQFRDAFGGSILSNDQVSSVGQGALRFESTLWRKC
jgi:hypothetical protein